MDNELTALGILFTEFYYWLTVVLMFLIHIGFCSVCRARTPRAGH